MEQPDTPDSTVDQTAVETATDTVDPDQALVDQVEETTAAPADDDEIEDDLDGVKVKGKKDLVERIKSERLMQSDYTRKTQALAQERQQIQQQAEFNQAFVQDVAGLKAIEMRIAEYDKVDMRALIQADGNQYALLQHERGELVKQKDALVQSLQAKQAHSFQQQQASLASLKEQAAAHLLKSIPGWSSKRDAEVADYVLKQGVPAAAVSNVMAHMPQFGVMAHKAELYDKLVAKAAKKPAPVAQEAPVTRIAATRATASKDPDKMSVEEWAKWRTEQVRKR
jgi:hypothetical protein